MSENLLDICGSFYFVGIGGVSMSALAKLLRESGKIVGGCDRAESLFTRELSELGIDVEITNEGDAAGYDALVYTDAVSSANQTILKAKRSGLYIVSRGELLAAFSKKFKKTIAVAGCHGKTTCTAMIAHIFGCADCKFCAHIGGSDVKYSNAYINGYDYFITEACEYKKNFLKLAPDTAVVLNSDADHIDCYGSVENLKLAYHKFAGGADDVIKLFGDLNDLDGETFGFDDRAQYYAKKIKSVNGKYSFTVYEGDCALGDIHLNAYGKHNVLNALAAVAVARKYGIDFEHISKGLADFCGVKRRFENIGRFNGAECIADYAHHPNEIKATLKTVRAISRGEIYVVFQPHTYSRTKTFFRQFVSVLSQVRKLLVYKTYAAREYYDDAGSALTLSQSLKRAEYGDKPSDILKFLRSAKSGDTILFLGAGDIYDIACGVVKN